MGCTISPILFVMAMEVILKAAEGSAGPANLGGACYMPPLKAFMDDTTEICSNEAKTRRMLEHLDDWHGAGWISNQRSLEASQ